MRHETQLPASEIALLPRTTRWRLQKRGWIRARRPAPKPLDYSIAQFESEFRTAYSKCHYFKFPAWITKDDLQQESYLQILKLSGDSRITIPGFRVVVMRRRISDLSKKSHEDDSYEAQHTLSLWQ